jgi:hypothetical protein
MHAVPALLVSEAGGTVISICFSVRSSPMPLQA